MNHSTRVVAPSATLEATFERARQGSLRVSYSLRNTGAQPLMIPDRGVAVGGKLPALAGGESAAPMLKVEDGAATLTHAVVALPKPAPTVPRIPLAARIEARASHEAAFTVDLPTDVKRVRYCVAVAPFSEDAFTAVEGANGIWRAAFGVAETQALVCTSWFDLKR